MSDYFDTEAITKGYDAGIARRILSYLKPYRALALVALLALALSTAGELLSPALIRAAIDEALVRQWYGIDPSVAAGLSLKAGEQPEVRGRLYVRASALAGLSQAERTEMIGSGQLDRDPSYLVDLEGARPEKIKLLQSIDGSIMEARWGVVSLVAVQQLASDDAALLREGDAKLLIRYALLLLGVLVLVLASTFLMTWFTNLIGTRIMRDMRMQLYDHILRQSLAFMSRQPVGRLVTRITSDIETISQFFTDVLSAFIKDASIMAGSLLVLFGLNVRLALIVSATLPITLGASAVARKKARDAFRNQRHWTSRVNAYLAEHISGIEVVKLFGQESRVASEFAVSNGNLLKANIAEMYVYATFRPFVDFMASAASALAIAGGAMLYLNMEISLGTLIAFINLISMFYSPIKDLSEKYILLQSAMAGGERVFGLLDSDERIPDRPVMPVLPVVRGHIEFRHVWFAYKGEEWVLRDVSFEVHPGEKVAIVGYTGAGKSTIANLLARFWDIQKGEILIDGIPLQHIPIHDLRRHIQPVPQDVFLFQGTVRENIALGLDLSQEAMERAARAVHAHEFIMALPQGYDTPLAEGGANLSQGQRQLLSFARVLAHSPSVIILDEATSAIDTETEKLLQQGIEGLLEGHTSIVIAHRLSTIRDADRILVLAQGRLVESGTHDELIARKGLYWNLYRLQNREMQSVQSGARAGIP